MRAATAAPLARITRSASPGSHPRVLSGTVHAMRIGGGEKSEDSTRLGGVSHRGVIKRTEHSARPYPPAFPGVNVARILAVLVDRKSDVVAVIC